MSWQSVWRMSRASSATAAGGVDPHDRGARQRRTPEEEEVLGHVLEEHADVERALPAQCREHAGPGRALGHDLAPGPRLVLEAQARVVVLGTRPARSSCHGRHRPDDSLRGPMGISQPRDLDAAARRAHPLGAALAARRPRRPPRPSGAARHGTVERDDLRGARLGPRIGACRRPPARLVGGAPPARAARDCFPPTTWPCRGGCRGSWPAPGCRPSCPSPSRRTTRGWARPSCSCHGWRAGSSGPTSPTCARDGWPRPRLKARLGCTTSSSTCWPRSTVSTGRPSAAATSWRRGPVRRATGERVAGARARALGPVPRLGGRGRAPAIFDRRRRVVPRQSPRPRTAAVTAVG